ncbi:MAG: ABC transporter ATP-binding protein [Propylenella sp.]
MPPPADQGRAGGPAGISIRHVAKSFGATPVLHDIDIDVRPGHFVCLLGPSGCGKTTLLRCIAGLERPDQGRIAIGDRAMVDIGEGVFVPPNKRRLGMVFQSYALWPHMNVERHIAYPLRHQGVPRAEQHQRIMQVMRMVGLPDVLDRRPSQLSGGQQQRVALARALVSEPPVLLLDEPLSNLDATLRAQLRRELRHLHERLGTTTVLVTHDQEEASALADTIALMHHGRIVQEGTSTEIFDRPRTRFVAEFVGYDNFVAGRLLGTNGTRARIALPSGEEFEVGGGGATPAGGDVLVAARSDQLKLKPAGAMREGARPLRGKVRRVARLGRGTEYEVMAGEQVVVARMTSEGEASEAAFEPGAEVTVDFLGSRSVMVARDGG